MQQKDSEKRWVKASVAGVVFYLSVVLGSVLHGADKVPKGFLLVASCVAAGLFSYFLGTGWAAIPIGVAGALVYWLFFRSGTTAKAELDFMYMADRVSIHTIWRAYVLPVACSVVLTCAGFVASGAYWLCTLPLLALPSIYVPVWASKKHADYQQKGFTAKTEREARQRVEIFSAIAPSGIYCVLLVLSASYAWKAVRHVVF